MALSVELNQAHRWFVAKCVRRIIDNVANSGQAMNRISLTKACSLEFATLSRSLLVQTMGGADFSFIIDNMRTHHTLSTESIR